MLTLGSHGAMYSGRKGEFSQPAYPVRAVDTTGAGDTFVGYFLAAVTSGKTERDAMDFAARASAVAVTRLGAAVAIPTMDEIKAFNFP